MIGKINIPMNGVKIVSNFMSKIIKSIARFAKNIWRKKEKIKISIAHTA